LLDRQQAFGWTQEDYKFVLEVMAESGEEAIGSMGNDAPLAILSSRAKPFYNYFRQLFAQVTNPPIDPIREQMVMSLVSFIGPKPNLLDINNVNPPLRLEVTQPILDFKEMARIRAISEVTGTNSAASSSTSATPRHGVRMASKHALPHLCARAVDAVKSGTTVLILTDRNVDNAHVAIPALLATSAIHQHLDSRRPCAPTRVWSLKQAQRVKFTTSPCSVATAPKPYIPTLRSKPSQLWARTQKAIKNYIKAIGKGLNKVMSKMGISTYMSYCGAQIFEAVGLRTDWSTSIFQVRPARLKASVSSKSPKKHCAHTAPRLATTPSWPMPLTRAENMPSACAAKNICGRLTLSQNCNTRRAQTTTVLTKSTHNSSMTKVVAT
jgi:glutamate synthase (NADPH) large chain